MPQVEIKASVNAVVKAHTEMVRLQEKCRAKGTLRAAEMLGALRQARTAIDAVLADEGMLSTPADPLLVAQLRNSVLDFEETFVPIENKAFADAGMSAGARRAVISQMRKRRDPVRGSHYDPEETRKKLQEVANSLDEIIELLESEKKREAQRAFIRITKAVGGAATIGVNATMVPIPLLSAASVALGTKLIF